MKYFIKMEHVHKIIDSYSARKDDFKPLDQKKNDKERIAYFNEKLKYMITIEPEVEKIMTRNEIDVKKTSRIIVRHTDGRGKVRFVDTWDLYKDELTFISRNGMKNTLSDYDIIRELEAENKQLKNEEIELKHQLDSLKEEYDSLTKTGQKTLQSEGKNKISKCQNRRKRMFNEKTAQKIKNDVDNGISITEIAKKYDVTRQTIYSYLKRTL